MHPARGKYVDAALAQPRPQITRVGAPVRADRRLVSHAAASNSSRRPSPAIFGSSARTRATSSARPPPSGASFGQVSTAPSAKPETTPQEGSPLPARPLCPRSGSRSESRILTAAAGVSRPRRVLPVTCCKRCSGSAVHAAIRVRPAVRTRTQGRRRSRRNSSRTLHTAVRGQRCQG